MTAFLTLDHVVKSFGETKVVHDFNLDVAKGEFISLLGPSGCGKTTVLRMIAGFEKPTGGRIFMDGKDVTALPPARRQIGMVFQAYALFPNLTVAENVAFGLRVAGIGRAERDGRVAEMLALIGLPQMGDRYPFQLSGGQQQRVALARALAPRPQVLLLDEPLSALDAKVRVSLRKEIRAIQSRLGITTLFVTHDQEEAMSISDRIVVMHQGRADQTGTPTQIYHAPATPFVASFVGTLNRLPAQVLDAGQGLVQIGGERLSVGRPLKPSTTVLAVRPESLRLSDSGLAATIRETEFLGAVERIYATLPDGTALIHDRMGAPVPRSAGETVHFSLDPADLIELDG